MSIINFIYKNEKYQIHEELLEGHTDFFQSVNENDADEKFFNLVDEFDPIATLTKDDINNFLQYFENQVIELNNSNIFGESYLSAPLFQ